MTIINADAKALEVFCAAYLSKDKVMIDELRNGVDMHTSNQEAFKLPSRLIAKIMTFRILYGGGAYSFANDPDFTAISTSEKFWQSKIDAFYNKYRGFQDWHTKIVQEASFKGTLVMPTGRTYVFKLERGFNGELKAPITQIKNFPVQGLGADLMAIARVSFARRFNEQNIKGIIVSTVHDSIVCDVHKMEVKNVAAIFHSVFEDLPLNFEKVFKVPFDLPMKCEVSVGQNMKELTELVLDN